MGFIAKVLNFIRSTKEQAKLSETAVNIGGGYTADCVHFSGSGDDSPPLINDYCVTIELPSSGNLVVIGYLDPKSQQTAQQGEKRLYARDSEGVQIAEIHLKNDGTVSCSNNEGAISLAPDGAASLTNGNGSATLEAGGDINLNGVIIDTSGNVSSPGNIDGTGTITGGAVETEAGVSLDDHQHPYTWTDPAGSGNTSPPLPS